VLVLPFKTVNVWSLVFLLNRDTCIMYNCISYIFNVYSRSIFCDYATFRSFNWFQIVFEQVESTWYW